MMRCAFEMETMNTLLAQVKTLGCRRLLQVSVNIYLTGGRKVCIIHAVDWTCVLLGVFFM